MVQIEVEIPIVCENDKCKNCGNIVNLVRGIRLEDIDLFYENCNSLADNDDYCQVCGELGVAEDAYLLD
ncbi:MAG: hypothetical protein OHK0041_01270 [Anaerolineales bacterium]